MKEQLLDFVPPFRFALVEDGVYRGAYPVLRNFPFLKTLGIKTILSITPEEAVYDLKKFAEAEQITLRYLQAERHKGEPQLLPTDLNEALSIILNVDYHPIYVHCLDGRHVLGLVIMALRRVLHWDVQAMHSEYLRFAPTSDGSELGFILDYAGGFTLPVNIPQWLWGGQWVDADGRTKKHPTLKIKFPHISGGMSAGCSLAQPSGAHDGDSDSFSNTNNSSFSPVHTEQRFLDISSTTVVGGKPSIQLSDVEALGLRGRMIEDLRDDNKKNKKRSFSV